MFCLAGKKGRIKSMSLSHEFLSIPDNKVNQLMSFSFPHKSGVGFGQFDIIPWPCDNQLEKIGKNLIIRGDLSRKFSAKKRLNCKSDDWQFGFKY